jgi:hypothetical protein
MIGWDPTSVFLAIYSFEFALGVEQKGRMRFGSGQAFGFARRGYGIIYSAAVQTCARKGDGPGTIRIGCHQEWAGKGGQARTNIVLPKRGEGLGMIL